MAKKRILVVDDEKGFSELVKLNLEKSGQYEVVVENDGTKALAAAQKARPDLILLDVMMPGIDGSDVAESIKADNVLKDTPIVFVTAILTEDEASSRGNTIGGYPFIAKPVSSEKLIDCIERNIKK